MNNKITKWLCVRFPCGDDVYIRKAGSKYIEYNDYGGYGDWTRLNISKLEKTLNSPLIELEEECYLDRDNSILIWESKREAEQNIKLMKEVLEEVKKF